MKTRLKIAIVIDAYDDCKNGAAISTKRFVELLKPEHEVVLITTGKPDKDKVLVPGFYPPFVSNVMRKMKIPLAIPYGRKLRKAIKEADLIHIEFPFLLAIRAVRIARKHKIPVVSTFHIQAEHLAMNSGINHQWFINGTYRVWLRWIYNLSDIVICPSKFAQLELIKYGLTAPSVVISNGILPVYRPMNDKPKSQWTGKFVILSVGRYCPEKGQKKIVEAVKLSHYRDKIQLILIGEGPLKEELESSGNELTNKIVFLTLKPEELIFYYNIADLYVHAASIEIEGMTILEAMGCGLPLLIANSPKSAARQFVSEPESLFRYDDVHELVKKIEYWIENPDKLREAGSRSLNQAGNYRIEKSYGLLLDEYLKCAGNGRE